MISVDPRRFVLLLVVRFIFRPLDRAVVRLDSRDEAVENASDGIMDCQSMEVLTSFDGVHPTFGS